MSIGVRTELKAPEVLVYLFRGLGTNVELSREMFDECVCAYKRTELPCVCYLCESVCVSYASQCLGEDMRLAEPQRSSFDSPSAGCTVLTPTKCIPSLTKGNSD